MILKLVKQEVGPWPMNCYILVDGDTKTSVIVDPGADPQKILAHTEGTKVAAILLTHGHQDHIGGLDEIKAETRAPVYLHPKEAAHFKIDYDVPLADGDTLTFCGISLKVIFTPGHTPGQCCFDIGDSRIIVGDTIFVGGPGRTWSSKDFSTTMKVMQEIVFKWPDGSTFYPGHGPSGSIGQERPAFEAFLAKGWPKKLKGDVTWKSS
jgi:glyoxylase-like metal-dependent hydrolase (beta-lactamase superfamily II)